MIKSLLFGATSLYLLLGLMLYVYQRQIIYVPQAATIETPAATISFSRDGTTLAGWLLNPGQDKALIYYGGNAERIEYNRQTLAQLLPDYSIYLIAYRGYGHSSGEPNETALFADALYIYDQLQSNHSHISLLGRSLGSGIASYVAAQRPIDQLLLVTPFDSIESVARERYPVFPVSWLLKDKFDSHGRAAKIAADITVISAANDRIIPPVHTQRLLQQLPASRTRSVVIGGAGHNDLDQFDLYQQTLKQALSTPPK